MATMTDDIQTLGTARRTPAGLVLAVVSAASFGMSGSLASGLLDTGWSAGAVVEVRIGLAALVLAPLGIVSLRGRWDALRRNAKLILIYGALAVAGAQFCYFSAVQHMQVGPALLIEYTSPAAVVLWLWSRHGERPGPLTLLGALLAAAGLVLVLGILSGVSLSLPGVLWALAAMVGAMAYFLVNGDTATGLPPLALAATGTVVGAILLGILGLARVLPMHGSTRPALYDGHHVAWWLPLLVLGLVTAALAYATGIAAGRHLGARLGSSVALLEVLAGVLFAWLLLGELLDRTKVAGGLLVLAGVVAIRLGEPGPMITNADGTASQVSEPHHGNRPLISK